MVGTKNSRYLRHHKLKDFGEEKQALLLKSKVLIVGAGGLGCPLGLYLAAAGVGTIGVVDHDNIELSNLQRQIAHKTEDIAGSKVQSLVKSMSDINPELEYVAYDMRLDVSNVMDIISGYDLVIDGSDNFATRYLLADACFLAKKPLLQGAVFEYKAQMSLFDPEQGPCYRCLFPEAPGLDALPDCDEVGVLGTLPGTLGLMMASEAIKYITGLGETLVGKLLGYDLLKQEITKMNFARDSGCHLCGEKPSIKDLSVHDDFETVKLEDTKDSYLIDVRTEEEYSVSHHDKAFNIPLQEISIERLKDFDKSKDLVLSCQTGIRARKAAKIMKAYGYKVKLLV